jgi:hypothetical protein
MLESEGLPLTLDHAFEDENCCVTDDYGRSDIRSGQIHIPINCMGRACSDNCPHLTAAIVEHCGKTERPQPAAVRNEPAAAGFPAVLALGSAFSLALAAIAPATPTPMT